MATIYKGKGSDTDPANYRPISLLNAQYKLFAAMIQKRLSHRLESRLRDTQFGFRAKLGTRDSLFVLRRLMEWTTMTSHNTQLLFLDWKQAFDSVDHPAMMNALLRFGLPSDCLALIDSIYTLPSFTTRGFMGAESHGVVNSGIRQGCPLSPYLFIIVLSVIFADLDDRLLHQGTPTNTWSEGKQFTTLNMPTTLFSLP